MKSRLFVAFTLGAFGLFGQSNTMAEGRYEAKYGRPMPGAQVRALPEPEGQACCRRGQSVAQVGGAEARNEAKYGRLSRAGEAQRNHEKAQVAMHVRHCVAMGHCDRVDTSVARVPEFSKRLQAKYGRREVGERPVVATMGAAECQEACCTHTE